MERWRKGTLRIDFSDQTKERAKMSSYREVKEMTMDHE